MTTPTDERARQCTGQYGSRVFVVVGGGGGSGGCCAYCFFARRRPEMGCTAYFRFYGILRLPRTMAATIEFHANPLRTKKYNILYRYVPSAPLPHTIIAV